VDFQRDPAVVASMGTGANVTTRKRALSATYDEQLLATAEFRIRRNGRFLIAELLEPYRVFSTSDGNSMQLFPVPILDGVKLQRPVRFSEDCSATFGQGALSSQISG
jgi:hypothetical protein